MSSRALIYFRNVGIFSKFGANALAKINARKASQLSYKESLLLPNTNLTTLRNRFRIASEANSSSSATVGLWIEVGSRYEKENKNGLTHLLEHLLFKGTPNKSQQALELEMDNLGITLNSHLSRDHLAIYARCLSKDVPKAVEVLSELVQNNNFSETDIEEEKITLLAELEASSTDLSIVTMDYLHATAFQGTSLGRSVMGTTETIKSITKKDIESIKTNLVNPPRIVLAGAGGVDHDQLVQLGEKYFGGITSTYTDGIPVIPPSRFTGSEIRARYDDEPFCHIAMAVEGPGLTSEDNLPLAVASAIVGKWDKSVGGGKNMASHVALAGAQAGLAESLQSFNISYQGTGLWGAYFVCDRMKIDDFFFNLQGEWMRICTSATKNEVERAKNAVRTSLFKHFDDSTLTCDNLAKNALFLGRTVSYGELEDRLSAITDKVVRDVAFKYVYDKCPALTCYGPTEQVPDYNRVRSAMYWLRY